ncbi:hypothetical protein PoB_000201700 [Plakobranchus ocellatus]|uniref:Uncharacterized protein n=1 Tax=Plakobranchus ocellatus TaxID=259542 RepID=A0AAV3XYH7_9GAST|nr:hypothetical protein PoB_000201700 [Plakobranchus ocellatus]
MHGCAAVRLCGCDSMGLSDCGAMRLCCYAACMKLDFQKLQEAKFQHNDRPPAMPASGNNKSGQQVLWGQRLAASTPIRYRNSDATPSIIQLPPPAPPQLTQLKLGWNSSINLPRLHTQTFRDCLQMTQGRLSFSAGWRYCCWRRTSGILN